jgi:hypothetical protein
MILSRFSTVSVYKSREVAAAAAVVVMVGGGGVEVGTGGAGSGLVGWTLPAFTYMYTITTKRPITMKLIDAPEAEPRAWSAARASSSRRASKVTSGLVLKIALLL